MMKSSLVLLLFISLEVFAEEKQGICDPRVCADICGTTGVDDFVAYTCNPQTCKCFCDNPPPPNCFLDQSGRCDLYCKQTYCGRYFGILCGSHQYPICTCACNPFGHYLRNYTLTSSDLANNNTLD